MIDLEALEQEAAGYAVEVLNEALRLDPEAINKLFSFQVVCNEALKTILPFKCLPIGEGQTGVEKRTIL